MLGYRGFVQQGFRIIAAFDVDRDKVDTIIDGVPVYHLERLPDLARDSKIKLAMVTVPAPAAQQVADVVVAAGIEGILNFAPVTLNLPEHIQRVGVDLAIELEQLSFAVVNRTKADGSAR